MLLHPFNEQHLLVTYEGTRLLQNDLGIVGTKIHDPFNDERIWQIESVYAPILGRMLGGVRVKLVDQFDFTTFCNQRDLEVLLGMGTPGRWCKWLGSEYLEPGEREWYGLCVDEEDLLDDLYERELILRQEYPVVLPPKLEITRRIHLANRADVEELRVLLWDMDPETGVCPDTRMSTVERRWPRVQRERIEWDRLC